MATSINKFTAQKTALIDSLTPGKTVLGVVCRRSQEVFTVDIGATRHSSLPTLSFEAATKRNLPNIHPGDVVYAKVFSNVKNTELVLTCVNRNNRSDGLGKMSDNGHLFRVSAATTKMYNFFTLELAKSGFFWNFLGILEIRILNTKKIIPI